MNRTSACYTQILFELGSPQLLSLFECHCMEVRSTFSCARVLLEGELHLALRIQAYRSKEVAAGCAKIQGLVS